MFVRSGSTWSQQAYVKASNTNAGDTFGAAIAISGDGSTLAIGAPQEASAAIGINGDETTNSEMFAGAVYVFSHAGSVWSQQAYVKASHSGDERRFGSAVALSDDGATLAVGAVAESSAATGVNGNQADSSAPSSGAAYVFTRAGAAWSQQAYLKASNTNMDDRFGFGLAISSDGATLAIGARDEDSAAIGLGGDQSDRSAASSGAVYVFQRAGTTWSQRAYVKASNTGAGDQFGIGVGLSSDGKQLAATAIRESGAATGISGDGSNNAALSAGAAYIVSDL